MRTLLMVAYVIVWSGPAHASVIASIDRANVELNESFTLKITVDTAIDVEPKADALEEDFFVGSRSQLSNTTIINGQITRSRTWTYVLMAKRDGDLVIPPVVVGSEQSEPVNIRVAPPSDLAPGEADIFVATEVDFEQSYVQAQVLYTIKVYRAVATRQPRLSDPEISGVDVLVEIAGEERSYDALMNGKSYNVVERIYALFPQESGVIDIAPAHFEARVLRDGRITGRKVFQSEPIRITVNPIPPPPDEFPDAAWLPAKSLTLAEQWSRDPDELPAGEPITRHLTVTALGQLSTQIPMVGLNVDDRLKVYPDKPELRVTAEPGGILASRRDQYAMIGVEAGEIELPEVRLPWWDIGAGAWKTATLPSRTLSILPSADALPPPAPAAPTAVPADDAPRSTVVVHSDFWLRVSAALAGVWVLTLFAWWLTRRPAKRAAEPAEPPLYKLQSRLLREARKAALAGDTAAVKTALLGWARMEWPSGGPRSIGDLALRVTDPLAGELDRLCRETYGPGDDAAWNGEGLAKALRNFAVRKEEPSRTPSDVLPPLMPSRPAP